MNDVVAVAVHDETVNAESHIDDKLPFDDFDDLDVGPFDILQLSKSSHHVFDDAHRILVERKGQQIFGGEMEEWDSILYGENFDDFLNEVSRIVIPAKLVVLLSDLHDH